MRFHLGHRLSARHHGAGKLRRGGGERTIIHTNILIFNLFAWLQNRMILRLNFKFFQNGLLLQEKQTLEEMVHETQWPAC